MANCVMSRSTASRRFAASPFWFAIRTGEHTRRGSNSMWVKEEAGSFTVEYRAVCADANQRLQYAVRIIGSNDGGLVFDAVAMPDTDFVTNRAGFVVLHPAWLARQKLKVTHVDDREEETRFPERISPSQPVFDIRALSHEVAPGLWATCRMEGDTFEMEDSATGPTRHTRPTCGLSRCRGCIRSPRDADTSSLCACRSRSAARLAVQG